MALPTFPLIDQSFFIRKINIPNVDSTVPRNAPILERLTSFISQYEKQCLLNILGYELSQLLHSEDSQRMTEIVNGAEYIDKQDRLRKWEGLVIPSTKESLIAAYVYYRFQEDSIAQTTGVSTAVNKSKGGTSISPADKMIDAWNYFSDGTIQLLSFLWNKNQQVPETYPEFTHSDYRHSLDFSRKINLFSI